MNNLLTEKEVELILRERFPSAVLTQQESGDFVISYRGWNNARIGAYMWSGGWELTHNPADVQAIFNDLHENALIKIEYGYYSNGNHHNWFPFVDFDEDFDDPMGVEVREIENDGEVTQYRLLSKEEYEIFKELEEEYNSLTRV